MSLEWVEYLPDMPEILHRIKAILAHCIHSHTENSNKISCAARHIPPPGLRRADPWPGNRPPTDARANRRRARWLARRRATRWSPRSPRRRHNRPMQTARCRLHAQTNWPDLPPSRACDCHFP